MSFRITQVFLFFFVRLSEAIGHVLCLTTSSSTLLGAPLHTELRLATADVTVAPARYVDGPKTVLMNASQHGLGGRELIIAALAALILPACGASKNQGQISSAETPPATQLIVQQNASAKKPLVKWPVENPDFVGGSDARSTWP
jgi:hypothetical protein